MQIFDNNGGFLGALPDSAVRIDSTHYVSRFPELTGKYVDADGVVYEADGTVNEPATALLAREIAFERQTGGYVVPNATQDKADTIQQQSQADQTRTYIDAVLSNVETTAQDVATRAANIGGDVFTALKWIVGGIIVIEVLRVLPQDTRRAMGEAARRGTQRARKRVRKYVRKQLAGA